MVCDMPHYPAIIYMAFFGYSFCHKQGYNPVCNTPSIHWYFALLSLSPLSQPVSIAVEVIGLMLSPAHTPNTVCALRGIK